MTTVAQPIDARLDEAVSRLREGAGAPLPIEAAGQVVAFLVTPEEMERLEDARDLALLRAARAEGEGPRVRLEDLAAELGVDLPH